MCQSIQQTPNGKNCVGGELSDRRGGRHKGTTWSCRKNLSSSAVQMLASMELKMSLTVENEEIGWVPDTWSFAFYRQFLKTYRCFAVVFFLLCFSRVKWREKPASVSRLCHHMKEKLLCVRDLGSPGSRWVEVSKHRRMVNAWRVHFARKTKAMWELKKERLLIME